MKQFFNYLFSSIKVYKKIHSNQKMISYIPFEEVFLTNLQFCYLSKLPNIRISLLQIEKSNKLHFDKSLSRK